jgi:class 3 adenylate cyclase/tetratricopeptide (TPR) repeat protein
MICSSCGTENEAGRKFCGECGSRLAVVCPVCGSANSPTAKFCGECATPLTSTAQEGAAGRPATAPPTRNPQAVGPIAERRLVSVLFADLVDFTRLAEGRDAEDTRQLLSGYFDLARDVIGRYGGTVEKFIGDAVMAVWGAPVAKEDDAERAVRAGLDLVDAIRRLGPGMQARAGVATGEAAVTIGATNQGMVAGDLVNTASRLQSVSPPGSVLVGEATQRASSRAIAYEEAGEQVLKGKASPVPAWRALRVVAQVGGRNRSETLEAPFVGRDTELRLLKDLFHATSGEQRARLVSVIGPAGIGKSRLAWEFLKYIDGLVELVWWHDGRSPAYGEGITFWALGEMVRGRCGLLETDDEPTTRAKVAETLAQHVSDPDERRWIEPALLTLLGIEPATTGSEQLSAGWRTFFERLAATAPVVLVFEDFHFADPGLLDFVDQLLDWSRNAPIYVLTLARPELLERRPEWGVGKRSFTSLHLEPLTSNAMRQLLEGLVPGLPVGAVKTIVDRADGIPLYAVETVRMLLAEGKVRLDGERYVPVGDLTRLAVPETLTALIASRLDGLGPEDRALVSDAAVLGQSFTVAGLSAVSGLSEAELEPKLRSLVRRELLALEADPRSPERGQHSFVQGLIREVAYNTLARSDRKTRHLAAARFFEGLESDEIAGALAGHYLAAHDNAAEGPEADALAAQARIALRAAAERALSLGSPRQAVGFLDQARSVTPDQADVADLLERAGRAADLAGLTAVAEERYRAAVELRREVGEPDAIAGAVALLGQQLINALRRDAAVSLLEAAVDELVPPDRPLDGSGRVALLAQLCRAYFMHDDYTKSIAIADRTLDAAERLDLVAIVSDVLITRGSALCNIGRPYEGLGALRAGIALADERGLVPIALRGRLNVGVLEPDPRASFEATEAALEIARRLGMGGYIRTLVGNLGTPALELGQWERIIEETMTARDESPDELSANYASWSLMTYQAYRGEVVESEVERLVAWAESLDESGAREAVYWLRAEVDFGSGRYAQACDKWLRYAPSDPLNAPQTCFYAGMAALLAGDQDRAANAQSRLKALPGHTRLRTADQRLLEAGLAALEGRAPDAVREARAVLDEYERMGLVWRRAQASVMLAATVGLGEPGVRELAESARETFVHLKARPFLERLDALLVTSSGSAERTISAPATAVPASSS